jgi:hypothetical protein
LSDDYEKISETLATWYEKRDKILDAQLDMINSLISSEMNARKPLPVPLSVLLLKTKITKGVS